MKNRQRKNNHNEPAVLSNVRGGSLPYRRYFCDCQYGRRLQNKVNQDATEESTDRIIANGTGSIHGVVRRLTTPFEAPRNLDFRKFSEAEKSPLPPIYATPMDWVDMVSDPGLTPSAMRELAGGPRRITTQADFNQRLGSAARFPVYCEGNLKRKGGGGGGKKGGKPKEFHWAADVQVALVDIDVDTDRNGVIEDADDPQENASVRYLDPTGALVLVNCDSDRVTPPRRDMDDRILNGGSDNADLSPLRIAINRSLRPGESVHLRMEATDGASAPQIHVFDPRLPRGVILAPDITSRELTNLARPAYFRNGDRSHDLLVEGLQFAREVRLILELKNGTTLINSDEVRILCCPWLANNNTSPMASVTPGNLVNSRAYPFTQGRPLIRPVPNNIYDAVRTFQGLGPEFVQDSCEWGFQVRRHSNAASGRALITALRLGGRSDNHPVTKFQKADLGVYGFDSNDERYWVSSDSGDQGGNIECLPPHGDFPFGRLLYGDTISGTLEDFFKRQAAQGERLGSGGATNWAGVKLGISTIGLVHVDEFVCVMPNKFNNKPTVIVPDWDRGLVIMRGRRGSRHQVPLAHIPSPSTYGDILDWLTMDPDGARFANLFSTGMTALRNQLRTAGGGSIVVGTAAGMYMEATPGGLEVLRSFPRNVANSQPTTANFLIVSHPPAEIPVQAGERFGGFYTDWERRIVRNGLARALAPENMTRAWRNGGEAHCASNTIRQPILY